MRTFLGRAAGAVIGLYFFTAMVAFIPYFNWTYARDHGLVRWILFGELVATTKAFAWPWFAFYSPAGEVSAPRSEAERRYGNSKKACDEALRIVAQRGDISALTSQEALQVSQLLRLAVREAQLVDGAYLAKIHPDFPIHYTDQYVKGLRWVADGLERKDRSLSLAGVYGYNEFAAWQAGNKNDLKW